MSDHIARRYDVYVANQDIPFSVVANSIAWPVEAGKVMMYRDDVLVASFNESAVLALILVEPGVTLTAVGTEFIDNSVTAAGVVV